MNKTLLIALLSCLALPLWAQDLLIRNASLYTLSESGVVEGADLLIADGRIRRIGSGLSAPADSRVIDAAGRPVTPAFFAGITDIGLTEVSAVEESHDSIFSVSPTMDMRPEFDVTTAYNPNSSLVPVTRVEGYGFTLLGASAGSSIIAGQGRMALLDGGYDSLAGDAVLFVNIGRDVSSLSGGSRAAQWMLLRQAISETRDAPDDGDARLLTRTGRATLKRLLSDGVVVFSVNRASDIRQVIKFSRENDLRSVVAGGAEAWMLAQELAAADVPVLLDPLINLPDSFDSLGARLDNAALLHAAGVRVAFTGAESHNARKQRQMAGNAVANGLPHEVAMHGLTRVPAEIFGLDNYGTLNEGSRADLVLWSGDPLEVTSAADLVILNGRVDSMQSRQTLLRDRYLPRDPGLPRAYVKP